MKRMLLVIAATAMLGGCVVARGPQGQIVAGFDIGKMPESISEVGGAFASAFLGPQMGNLVSTSLALVFGGGAAAYGVNKERGRRKADQGREKVNNELIAAKALLSATGLLDKFAREDPVDPVEPS